MNSHRLTEADRWFIDKRQIDPLSRTPFNVGMSVVVCEHKHVMLTEFYDGTCPTCKSTVTVPFTRTNVEYAKPPKPKEEFLKWFFPSKFIRRIIPKVNRVLGCIIGVLAVAIFVLIMTGTLSNQLFMQHIETIAIPKTYLLLSRLKDFLFSDAVSEQFVRSFKTIGLNTREVLGNAAATISVLGVGLIEFISVLARGLHIPYQRSRMLYEHVGDRTTILIEIISGWINGIIARFT